jgi:hypothetical protein
MAKSRFLARHILLTNASGETIGAYFVGYKK